MAEVSAVRLNIFGDINYKNMSCSIYPNPHTVKVVLTGGPMAGKTSILNYLKHELGGSIMVIPEIATFFEKNILRDQRFFSPSFNRKISKLFFSVQSEIEDMYQKLAEENLTSLILCDRGLLDGAAYYNQGEQKFLDLHKISKKEIYKRYDAVIWMETVAKTESEKYKSARNSSSVSSALYISQANLSAWGGHPRFFSVSGNTIRDKKQQVNKILCSLLRN